MAQADSAKMRLFTTFAGKAPAESIQGPASGAQGEGTDPARRLKQLSAGSSRWSPFFAFSSKHDLPTTSLLLQCIGLGHASSQELRTFDGQAAGAGGSGGGAAARDGLDGQLAAALAERLVPGWWHLTHTVPGWRWHLQNLLESPCLGVPGLCCFAAARAAWLARHVQLAVDGDSCRQVVLLRSGWSPLAHSLAQPGVVFYEVDSRSAVQRKKEALDALLPGWRRSPARPRFAEVDFSGSLKTLITELTGAGFDPSLRCCVVAEGLLAYLLPDQADSLLRDLSALCAPGSRILFDFLHSSALEGGADALPGFPTLAAAAANKGAPLRGGMRPAFSAMVKLFQPHQFRAAQVLQPHDVAAFWQQQQDGPQPAGGGAPAGGGGIGAAAAAGASKWPAAPQRLPYVPEFFGLAEVIKIDSRLLLRRAASSGGGAPGGAAGVGGWVAAGAAAALASPSCLVRSLAFLLWGGASLRAPPAPTPTHTLLPAGAAAALDPPPPLPAAGRSAVEALQPPAGSLPLHSQQSAEWSLAAVSSSQPAAACSPPASPAAAAPGSHIAACPPAAAKHASQGGCSQALPASVAAQGAAAAAAAAAEGQLAEPASLQHALSIGPMGAPAVSGAAVRSASSASEGSHQAPCRPAPACSASADGGHLLANGGSGGAAAQRAAERRASGGGEAALDDETSWSESSLFSFSLFF